MMPRLPVSSTPQCESRHQQGADLELFQIMGCFDFIFTEAHLVSCMICKDRTLKLPIRASPFLGRDHDLYKESI